MRSFKMILLLSFSACGQDAVSAPPDAGWAGDPAPAGTYAPRSATFMELCQDGSSRYQTLRPAVRIDVQPSTLAAGRFGVQVTVKDQQGNYVEDESWGELAVASDGMFDTAGDNRAAHFYGQFEREGTDTRVRGMFVDTVVEIDFVQCDRTYDFTHP